ncbi:MAG TPA: alpha-2-macroglobulin family protein, partial [Thermoanaerobaculia bacterium]|nr:alpha-2-macroglobulin family protein [Thermoanaerobaculia bacterium]
PVEHFLDVDVKLDREQFEPRQEGAITVTTRDLDGRPVPAEVALSVSDESVTAIAQDPAGDPRQFFFGERRYSPLQVSAGVQSQRFVRLIEGKDGKLIQERTDRAMRDGEKDQALFVEDAFQETLAVTSGVAGGVVGGVSADYGRYRYGAPPPSPAAPPPVAANAVTEAVPQSGYADMSLRKEVAAQAIDVQVRSDFRSTALWKPDLVTGADGTATVKLKFPEALTTWRATARAVSTDTRIGMGSSTARTNMPLIVRLQAPRFFVAGDRATVSAVINNNTDEEVRVTPALEVEGLAVSGEKPSPITIAARGEGRADWTVVAEHAGAAKLRVKGTTATRGDAMEKTFIVYEHGVDKLIARSGKLRGDEAIVKLDLPARRATQLTVQVAPSLAVAMIDALPYLINYPYGCTEQTMSRFLPAAIVARTLSKNGLDINDRIDRKKLDDVTAKSMARLYDFQHGDGGWGWWKDGESDDFMTAYVVWGFSIAREAGLKVRSDAVDRAVSYLEVQLAKNENQWHDEAWILHAISAWRSTPTAADKRAFDDAWKNRDKLTSYSRALLALTAHRFGDAERAQVLVRNLEDGVKLDKAPDQSILVRGSGANAAETMATAHWGEDRFWWRWYDGPVETTAFALQALVSIDPKHRLIEPVMNWLVKNRRGAQWNNTRDTAIALLAFNDYLRASDELRGDVSYELSVNGTVIATKTLSAADVLRAPSTFTIDDKLVKDANEIRIRRTRGGTLYFSAEARFVSLEEPVAAAGNEIFVRRDYFRLVAKPTLLKGVIYERIPLLDRQSMKSGERVEVVVTIETKNDYEYLLFEDLKPAGLEAVALQSGEPLYAMEQRSATVTRKFGASDTPPAERPTIVRRERTADQTGRSAWVYQELRDRKVAMFIDHLPQGVWEIGYPLRAEVPGFFHALPLLGQAMYVPEIRANSTEVRLTVE